MNKERFFPVRMAGSWAGFLYLCLLILPGCNKESPTLENTALRVEFQNTKECLWTYVPDGGRSQSFAPPLFEIDNKEITGIFREIKHTEKLMGKNGVKEHYFAGRLADLPEITMKLIMRISPDNAMVRFRYFLSSEKPHILTKTDHQDHLTYLSTSLKGYPSLKEIRLSQFFELAHTYVPGERTYSGKDIDNELSFMGPIFVGSNGKQSMVLTYEHGSQLPDRFIEFRLHSSGSVSLNAVKGNYYDGFPLDAKGGYHTVWMNLGICKGGEKEIAMQHRDHVLHYMAENNASRKPYIFYNTWNYQERNKNWYGKPYLHSMNRERMLEEIDIAHQMGVEVFVIDAGWFGKTGDWTASESRFPDGPGDVKARLDSFGMKLGLWFNSDASVTSNMLKRNRYYIMTMDGVPKGPHQVWETEESYTMCMVSPFGDDFARELIRVAKEYGVTYFKWDAFSQYGCNAAGHGHGTRKNTPEERAESYSFQLPLAMARIAGMISDSIPGAIIDFDVTEGQRAFGLAFLSAGKYFTINNGPYYYSLDDPEYAPGGGMGANVLVFPGIARAANARIILPFDYWIPSTLFLTHYLPDDPEYSQWINIGSLILGQNGIWGDLPKVSAEGIQRFATTLSRYKQVRDDITRAYPVITGKAGSTPEIYEKIDAETGKGAVIIFYNYKNAWYRNPEQAPDADFQYVTTHRADTSFWTNGDTEVSFDRKGRAKIDAHFTAPGAKILFFGVQ